MPMTIKCEVCGKDIPTYGSLITYVNDNDFLVTCANCYGFIGSCQTCAYGNKCNFSTDHSEPQIVNQTIQRGPMVMTTQVRNPKLVEKHCINCRCSFGTQGECCKLRNDADCPNYIILSELLYKKI